ncbi:endocuticle structural glycoprotein SgAbd-2 isoform X2 [Aethina tumida]|uniref:endocuticle structural glycoprotein SgAbd-2 isoform X2 n=1 Tax=Aethina tumida TaxID=116153 RepID=UPI002148EBF6|nr:endocuticle structural glycoprotein SgAbd-2 isoform X2 [Aethina tumida]
MMKLVVACALFAIALADVSHLLRKQPQQYSPGQEIPILRQESDITPEGSYKWAYETGNGISAQEQGQGGVSAQGNFAFTSLEGVPVAIQYVADENGFQPSGDSIPQPPPIPEDILKSIAWNEAQPEKPEPLNNRRF